MKSWYIFSSAIFFFSLSMHNFNQLRSFAPHSHMFASRMHTWAAIKAHLWPSFKWSSTMRCSSHGSARALQTRLQMVGVPEPAALATPVDPDVQVHHVLVPLVVTLDIINENRVSHRHPQSLLYCLSVAANKGSTSLILLLCNHE